MARKFFSLLLMMTIIFSSLAVVNTSAATIKKSRGDLNGDQVVDLKDILILKKHLAGISVSFDKTQADCNNDGTVDSKDSLMLQRFLSKTGSIYYDTVEDNSPGWHTIENWESYSDSTMPSNVASLDLNKLNCGIKDLSNYSVKNTYDASSKKALTITPKTKICNPTIKGSKYVKIKLDQTRTVNATNLRMCLNLKDTSGKEVYVINVGINTVQGFYYHKIDLRSYTSFQYFYFANKNFTKMGEESRTYLDNEVVENLTLTKDMIPDIKYICFWIESSGNTPTYVDNIDYFVGDQGYDSTAEDNAIVKPEPTNDGQKKYLSLSFDDGPQTYSPANTAYMNYYLDLAEQYNAKFSFFVIGDRLESKYVDVLKRAVNLGSEIQNHTWNHNYLKTYDSAAMKKQLTDVDDWLEENVGVKTTMVRPPYLDVNQTVYDTIDTTCIGGYCSDDYNGTSLDYKFEYYKMYMKDGAIALIHEHFITNVKLVQMMLEYFGKQGYEFVSITEMFNIKGITPAHNKLYNNIG